MAIAHILEARERIAAISGTASAQTLAEAMPRLTTEARRIAATAAAGLHGRRRAGQGDSFWQFRTFGAGESASRIDWRRSARDSRLYVREREWEAAENIWLWMDRSPSMNFISNLAKTSKLERTIVLGLAVADMLVRGGERTGLFQLTPPQASRRIIERLGEALIISDKAGITEDMPPAQPIGAREEIILIGDFIGTTEIIRQRLEVLAARGGRGHLLMISDPIEDVFPFKGETEFEDPQDGSRLRVGDAAAFAAGYHDRIAAHRAELRRIAQSLGWTLTLHRTDRPAVEPLYALIMLLQGNFVPINQSIAG